MGPNGLFWGLRSGSRIVLESTHIVQHFLGRPLQRDGPYNRYGPSPGTKMSKISDHVIGWFNILRVWPLIGVHFKSFWACSVKQISYNDTNFYSLHNVHAFSFQIKLRDISFWLTFYFPVQLYALSIISNITALLLHPLM